MEYDKLQIIENKADKLLRDVKYGSGNASYTNAFYLMLVLYIIAVSAAYIMTGESILIYLAVLVIALVLYRGIISSEAKKAQDLSNYKSFNLEDKVSYVTRMLQYLGAEIEVKIARVKALRLFYMMCFPFFLVVVAQTFLGTFIGSTLYVNMAVAVFIGVIFWYVFFKGDIVELGFDKTDVDDMIKKIKS